MFLSSPFSNIPAAIALACAISFAGIGASFASTLDGDAIENLVSGKKVYLKIPIGGEFPLRYGENGIVKGDGSAVGLGRFFAPKDQGKWWVRNDQLCQQWTEWYKGKTTCFAISDLEGKNFRWKRTDGREGEGRIE